MRIEKINKQEFDYSLNFKYILKATYNYSIKNKKKTLTFSHI